MHGKLEPPPDKTFFELLPKGRLLAAVTLILLLAAVLYVRRHAGGAMEQLKNVVSPGAPAAPPASKGP